MKQSLFLAPFHPSWQPKRHAYLHPKSTKTPAKFSRLVCFISLSYIITYPFYILSEVYFHVSFHVSFQAPKFGPGQATCSGWRPSYCCKWIGPPPPPLQCWWSYRPPRPCRRLPARWGDGAAASSSPELRSSRFMGKTHIYIFGLYIKSSHKLIVYLSWSFLGVTMIYYNYCRTLWSVCA